MAFSLVKSRGWEESTFQKREETDRKILTEECFETALLLFTLQGGCRRVSEVQQSRSLMQELATNHPMPGSQTHVASALGMVPLGFVPAGVVSGQYCAVSPTSSSWKVFLDFLSSPPCSFCYCSPIPDFSLWDYPQQSQQAFNYIHTHSKRGRKRKNLNLTMPWNIKKEDFAFSCKIQHGGKQALHTSVASTQTLIKALTAPHASLAF